MNNMMVGASSTSFSAVKTAFENNYGCMEITCHEVGGLWFRAQNEYYDGANPCGTVEVANGAAPHPRVLPVAKVIIVITMIFCCLGQ